MQITTILYRLAVSLWVGGAALFTFLLTPAIFRSYSRDLAGGIVGVLFPGYFRWGLACGAVALICLAVSKGRPAVAPTIIIAAMMIITALQAFVIEPRAVELKKAIPSFESTPPDNPLRAEFRKLHGISAACNLAVIGGGVALVVLF
jgi:uncharacterized membrane protein